MFKPNFDLYKPWEDSEKVYRPPYLAVFRKNAKTLLYIAEKHGDNKSFDMTDFCFSEKSPAKPEIAVVEFENSGRKINPNMIQNNNLVYAAAVATKHNTPVVFADLSDDDNIDVLNKQNPGRKFTIDDLNKVLTAGGPSTKKGEYSLLSHQLNMYGRDPFMINNIMAALNKYDVVLAVFGEGHYRSQRLIIEDMMGTPEYIKSVPNSRGDFDNLKIQPIDLGIVP
ncbi:MAG: hypothetical protein LBD50_00620 [Rickettsiales bacterium]|jgi:hypothetical protein|nr:hypothetical protein [Rickettsiales bacterium]